MNDYFPDFSREDYKLIVNALEKRQRNYIAGDTLHFVNEALPPHNIIVEARPDLSREALLFAPGESQDVVFADAGDYNFFCGPHQGAGMTGVIHVN